MKPFRGVLGLLLVLGLLAAAPQDPGDTLTVTLDESKGMLPDMKLSMFPRVVVGARVSKSGNAMPSSGDLQVLSAPVDVTHAEPLALVIDEVVP